MTCQISRFDLRQCAQKKQSLVQFVRVGRSRPRFLAHFFNRGQIEHPKTASRRWIAGPSRVNRLCSALFQRRVVEKRVWLGIQNLVRQRRRFREIESDALNGAVLDPFEQIDQAVDVHRLGKAVFDRLLDQRMARNHPVSRDIFQAGELVGKNSGQEVF